MYIEEGMSNPFSEDERLDAGEANAVRAIFRAAEEVENALIRLDLTASGRVVLNRCYREMRRTIEVYIPEKEHALL